MKKLIFTLALLIQTAIVFAATPVVREARVNANEVKMYRQPGTSSDLVKSLNSTDEIIVLRQHNANWSIVSVNGKAGYVLSSELIVNKNPTGKTNRSR